MRTIIAIITLALVVMSCTTTTTSTDSSNDTNYYGYIYDGAKLVKYVSMNNDTVIWYDWSPSDLQYWGDHYTYMGKKCVVSFNDHADVFCEMDDLEEIQWLDEHGQYTDLYYDLLSSFSPVWIESQQCYTLYHW